MLKVLVVDDAEEIFVLVHNAFRSQFKIDWAADLKSARAKLQSDVYDLLLLDVTLPDGDGFSFFAEIQSDLATKSPAVIFLTSKSALSDKVLGLSLGAEDYITKNCEFLELKARIESKLKKIQMGQQEARTEKLGPLEVDHRSQRVTWEQIGKAPLVLDLTRIEFKILCLLLSKKGELTQREEILDRVWGRGFSIYPRSVDTHVSNLRKKIPSKEISIETVHGQGYRLSLEAN